MKLLIGVLMLFSTPVFAKSFKLDCDKNKQAAKEQEAQNYRAQLTAFEAALGQWEKNLNQSLQEAAQSVVNNLKKTQAQSAEISKATQDLENSFTLFNEDKSVEARDQLIKQFNQTLSTMASSTVQGIRELQPSSEQMTKLNADRDGWFKAWSERNAAFANYVRAAGEFAGVQIACELKDRFFK